MQIEIYVVKTEISKKHGKDFEMANLDLNLEKQAIMNVFGGITVIPNLSGAWLDEKLSVCHDDVEIWRVCSSRTGNDSKQEIDFLKRSVLRIKAITEQKSQLYTIDPKIDPIFV